MENRDVETIAVIVCIFLPFGLILFYTLYRVVSFEIGPGAAAKQMRQNIGDRLLPIVGAVLGVGLLMWLAPPAWRYLLLVVICATGFLVVFWLAARATIRRRRLPLADILLNLGRIESIVMLVAGIMFGIVGIISAMQVYASGRIEWASLFTTLLLWATAYSGLAYALSDVYVTVKGFSRFEGDIAWQEIAAYQWAGPHDPVLTLTLKKKGRISWYIPTRYREELERLLHLYLDGRAQVENNQN
jgi:hypothetical protein